MNVETVPVPNPRPRLQITLEPEEAIDLYLLLDRVPNKNGAAQLLYNHLFHMGYDR